MGLNPTTPRSLGPWKNCLPQNWSPVQKSRRQLKKIMGYVVKFVNLMGNLLTKLSSSVRSKIVWIPHDVIKGNQ